MHRLRSSKPSLERAWSLFIHHRSLHLQELDIISQFRFIDFARFRAQHHWIIHSDHLQLAQLDLESGLQWTLPLSFRSAWADIYLLCVCHNSMTFPWARLSTSIIRALRSSHCIHSANLSTYLLRSIDRSSQSQSIHAPFTLFSTNSSCSLSSVSHQPSSTG